MASMSDYLENAALDHVLGTSTFTAPSNLYLALFTANPAEDGTGTEVSGAGYARQEVTFGAASSGLASSTNTPTFTADGGDFGTITHVGIFDASTNGNMLFYAPIATARTITDKESIVFQTGDISISFA